MAVPLPHDLLERRTRAADLLGGLPEVASDGERTVAFRVVRRTFAWMLDDPEGDGRLALKLRPVAGDPTCLIAEEPDARFLPHDLGARGWMGVWLDVEHVNWESLEHLVFESYLRVAPARLAAQLGH